MFGLDKLKQMKKQAEEMKARLDVMTVEGTAASGAIRVEANASKRIHVIQIDQSFFNTREKLEIERCLCEAVNDALRQADEVSQKEMKSMMPNIPGLGL
jgi:DNA-binding YbaB/EbfC family protein